MAETTVNRPDGWCLNCIEWGDPPTPERAHPAAECPWRPAARAAGADLREQITKLIADDQAAGWQESLPEDLAEAILGLPAMRPLIEQPAVDCGHHSWAGLMALLDEHWPAEVFPTLADDPARDAGVRIVSLLRWVNQLLRQSMEGAGR